MIQINAEQMAAFQHNAEARYADDLCARLSALYPEETTALGDARLRRLVAEGIPKARTYDLAAERDVALFVDLMLFLGAGFDTDPNLPWAAAILNDDYITDPQLRIDTLHARALQHFSGTDQTEPEGSQQ